MNWTAHKVVFELKSPMHIGCGKVGNVQRTRTYVTGRVFWGALTMRLTRDATDGPATHTKQYECYAQKVHEQLVFTYFYPAIKQENEDYQIQWPWEDESLFRRRFLSSYASTALMYSRQSAEEGLLHEVEFISPRTLDEGKQVYLVGYVFAKKECELQWKCACNRLQFGGERGYGWGDVKLKCIEEVTQNTLFNGDYSWDEDHDFVKIKVLENKEVLAHTTTKNVSIQGEIEPLVGREWKSHNQDNAGNQVNCFAGQSIEFSDLYWVPGSKVRAGEKFKIRDFGIWFL